MKKLILGILSAVLLLAAASAAHGHPALALALGLGGLGMVMGGMRDIHSDILPEIALQPTVCDGAATVKGEITDGAGFAAREFVCGLNKTATDGTYTYHFYANDELNEGGTDLKADDEVTVIANPEDLIGAIPVMTEVDQGTNKCFSYIGQKRYTRLDCEVTEAGADGVIHVTVIKGLPAHLPAQS